MSAHSRQVNHDALCEALRGVLLVAVESGPSAADGINSIQCRACAALYALLTDHPVDQRGRCRSCRPPGAVLKFGRRRCRVHSKARVWLQQPAQFLCSQLAHELGLPTQDSTALRQPAT